MATLGKTTIGLTDFSSANTLSYVSGPYMASEDGTIDSVSVYTTTTGVGLRMGVYVHDETTNSPTTLIASTDSVTTVAGWQTGAKTGGDGLIEKGKRYWLAFIADNTITYKLNLTEEKSHWNQNAGAGFTLRNPFQTGGGSTFTRAISAYFSYTPTLPPIEDTSLQARINRAAPGSTVYIRAGFYNEHLRINKPLKLVGVADRRGRLPIIQGGTLIENWILSEAAEHVGKNVWYKDVSINGVLATWVRSLQLDEKGVQVLQYHPLLAGEGVIEGDGTFANPANPLNPTTATWMRNAVLTRAWSDPSNLLFAVAGQTIDFWEWYDAIACHERINTSTGRLWLRLKNNVNPNNSKCYVTLTQNMRAGVNGAGTETRSDRLYSNEIASVIKCENQTDVTIRNLEIRGGRYGIDIQDSSNVVIEKCKVVTPALRSIEITDCTNVMIQRNEMTSNRMRTNMGPGFGGTTDRAKAMMFGWSLNKNYSTSGAPSPAGHSVQVSGVTSGVTVRRNWMHGDGGGVSVGSNDVHMIDVVIENNIFEKMDSQAILVSETATGTVRYNIFYEVHLNFRIQNMMGQLAFSNLNNLVTVENNIFRSLENAGYLFQAHYAGEYHKVTYSGGSGSLPAAGDTITWNEGLSTGLIVRLDSGSNVSGVLTLRKTTSPAQISPDDADVVVSGSWTADLDSVELIHEWTTPVVFRNNVVQNVSTLIANLEGFADVEMDNNVIDVTNSIPSSVITYDIESFTNNWVGGNASTAPNEPWWGAGNNYTLNQRLVCSELPVGWEQVGTYRQNVGLPTRRRALTYGKKANG